MTWGGFSYVQITDEHRNIIDSKKNEIETILIQKGRNGKIEHIEIVDVQQQIVRGLNLLFKIQLQKDGNEYIQVGMYKNLNNEVTIHSVGTEL